MQEMYAIKLVLSNYLLENLIFFVVLILGIKFLFHVIISSTFLRRQNAHDV